MPSVDLQRLKRGAVRRAGRAAGLAIEATGIRLETRGRARMDGSTRFADLAQLTEHHFATWSDPAHANRSSLEAALALLSERSAVILETGSSAWGTNSSQLFDAYVSRFGGEFATVDLRMGPMLTLRPILSGRSTLVRSDSVRFLEKWVADHPGVRADLVYLDSWDLDASNPMPSAAHGLSELLAILPALRDGSLVLVDDSPSDLSLYAEAQRESAKAFEARTGLFPGKGMLIDLFLADRPGVEKLHHGYQALYRFD